MFPSEAVYCLLPVTQSILIKKKMTRISKMDPWDRLGYMSRCRIHKNLWFSSSGERERQEWYIHFHFDVKVLSEFLVRRLQAGVPALGIARDAIRGLDPSGGWNKTSISHYLRFNQIPAFFPATKLSLAENKPSLIKEGLQLIFQAMECFIQKVWGQDAGGEGKKKENEIHLHPTSGKLLLTFNLFQQEMGSYIVTTVNRRVEERGAIRQDCQL